MPQEKHILLSHGDGGLHTRQLLEELFLPAFGNPLLAPLEDAARLDVNGGRLAFTTDSFVVKPLFFPGGDIGRLAVCGTVNDLTTAGACPLCLSAAFMLEEGLEIAVLQEVVTSMAAAAREAGVQVVTGDTKVVGRGELDGLFVNTAGVGVIPAGRELGPHRVKPGDRILLSGAVGDHELAVALTRDNLGIATEVRSDCAPLAGLVAHVADRVPGALKYMRDPTRGGVATVASEMAASCGCDFYLWEENIPLHEETRSLCDLLGLDPLYLANEGKMLAVVDGERAEEVRDVVRQHALGAEAELVGQVRSGVGRAFLVTPLGGTRRLELLAGAQFPRIC